jgi:hypothetical protein
VKPHPGALAATLMLLVAAVSAQAPQRRPRDVPRNQSAPNTGVITGIVRAADTGAAVRGADVRLTGADFSTALGNGIRGAFTDANGRYEFRGLPEGQYTLSASKVRYVSATYGQTRASERGTPVKLVNGQRVQNVDIALPVGAVIVVRLIDRFGDPAVGYHVNVHQATVGVGKRPLAEPPVSSFGSTTDDRGEFRMSGLSPGEYFISAEGGAYLFPTAAVPRQQEVLTFYPGTDSDADAQPVMVGFGDEVVAAFTMVSRLVSPADTR